MLAAAATSTETRERFILFLFLLQRSLLLDSVHGVNVEEILQWLEWLLR